MLTVGQNSTLTAQLYAGRLANAQAPTTSVKSPEQAQTQQLSFIENLDTSDAAAKRRPSSGDEGAGRREAPRATATATADPRPLAPGATIDILV